MVTFRRFLLGALLCSLASLAGCELLSSEAWQRPSPLSVPPPALPPPQKHEPHGGFYVLVNAPGQPSAVRVASDIGAFAQTRGFVSQSAEPGAQRYVLGQIVLDVAFRAGDLRVIASLHSAKLSRKFVDTFHHDFDRQYGRQYGEENPIFESDFSDE